MAPREARCVPIVDLSAFTNREDLERQTKTAAMLSEACQSNGCVGFTGHGVPRNLLERAFAMSKSLFDLPLEEKLKAPHPEGTTPHRGYTQAGKEKGGAKGLLDSIEQAKESTLKGADFKVRTPHEY